MDRRTFFRGALIASSVVGIEASHASSANAFFRWWWWKLDEPSLSLGTLVPDKDGNLPVAIPLIVKAGCNGAPAGFTVQWMTKAEYTANCNRWYSSSDPRLCKAVFLPADCNSHYYLDRGESVQVDLGILPTTVTTNCPVLQPLTDYIIRAFANGVGCYSSSDFSCSICATTPPPGRPPF